MQAEYESAVDEPAIDSKLRSKSGVVNMAEIDMDHERWCEALSTVVKDAEDKVKSAIVRESGSRYRSSVPRAGTKQWAEAYGNAYNKFMELGGATGYWLDQTYDLPMTTVQEYRKGRTNPTFYRFIAIAHVLGIRPSVWRRLIEADVRKIVERDIANDKKRRTGRVYEIRDLRTRDVSNHMSDARVAPRAFFYYLLFVFADSTRVPIDDFCDDIRDEFVRIKKRG